MILKIAKFSSSVSTNIRFHFFEFLFFLYFVTLHADQLQWKVAGYSVRFNNLLACALVFFLLLRLRPKALLVPRFIWTSLTLLSFSLLISSIISPFQRRCAIFFVMYGMTILCYFFLPYFFLKYYSAERVFRLYFLSFLCVGGYAFFQLFFSFFGILDPFALQHIAGRLVRPHALSYEPSFYALYMTPFVMMLNLHFIIDRSKRFFLFKKVGVKELALVNGLYLLSTTTSSFFAYFVFFVVAFSLFTFSYARSFFIGARSALIKFGVCIASLTLLFALLFPGFAKTYFLKFFLQGFMKHASFLERWVGMKNAWHLFLQHPIFGVGLGAYPEVLYKSWVMQDQNFTQLNGAEILLADNPLKFFEPSNLATEVLASLGIVGLLACGFLSVNFYRASKKAFFEAEEGSERRHWIVLLLFSLVVTAIVLQFNQGFLRTYIWAHFGLACAFMTLKNKTFTKTSA
jgi:O-antigen ligase